MVVPPGIVEYHTCKKCGGPIRNVPKRVPLIANLMVCRYCSRPPWKTRDDFLGRKESTLDAQGLEPEIEEVSFQSPKKIA